MIPRPRPRLVAPAPAAAVATSLFHIRHGRWRGNGVRVVRVCGGAEMGWRRMLYSKQHLGVVCVVWVLSRLLRRLLCAPRRGAELR